ncbi:oxygen-independent coproporphyrinogen III oxidase [soil metagenome]
MRPDLIARYAEERLPRYTSYPTAPHFSPAVGPAIYAEWLESIPAGTPTSLYVHVPYCRRMCWYCGCNTAVTLRDKPVADYGETLQAEIALVRRCLAKSLPVVHLHFGGGTPTIMAPTLFQRLMETLRASFDFRADAEIAIEIDPRTLTGAMVAALAAAGVNRASLGVQSLDPLVQRAINRVQTYDETARAVRWLRAAGIRGINLDLIYGLPHQTVASAVETVTECLALGPDRVAVFGYAHVPAFKRHQRKIDAAALPGGPARNAQAEAIGERLVAAGYRQIGIDHYARAEDPLAVAGATGRLHRNFQGYTTDPADLLIGLGASAIGRQAQGYVQNDPVVRSYAANIAAGRLATVRGRTLTADDRLRGEVIERLMCDFRVDLDAVCQHHGGDAGRFADALAKIDRLAADGIVRRDGGLVEVEPEARGLARAVASSFDAYLTGSTGIHSPMV